MSTKKCGSFTLTSLLFGIHYAKVYAIVPTFQDTYKIWCSSGSNFFDLQDKVYNNISKYLRNTWFKSRFKSEEVLILKFSFGLSSAFCNEVALFEINAFNKDFIQPIVLEYQLIHFPTILSLSKPNPTPP